ncbi:MAG: hypothetical protein HY319_06260 [Armatimonadetes bacterium]|nr:hypothetical protein [Armatimonadota bacterium]
MNSRSRLNLNQVFVLSLIGLVLSLGSLFFIFYEASRASVQRNSHQLLEQFSQEAQEEILVFMLRATDVVEEVEAAMQLGELDPGQPDELEEVFYRELLVDEDLGEIAFTFIRLGRPSVPRPEELERHERGQLSVVRELERPGDGEGRILTRRVVQEGDSFGVMVRARKSGASLRSTPFRKQPGGALDPAADLTFRAALAPESYSRPIWSDLRWVEGRGGTVTLHQALQDSNGVCVGVLRVGLRGDRLEQAMPLEQPYQRFLCDRQGRLITRLGSGRPQPAEDALLRVPRAQVPPEVQAALGLRVLGEVNGQRPYDGAFTLKGEKYLVAFRALDAPPSGPDEVRWQAVPLPKVKDWLLGIVVPEVEYTRQLAGAQQLFLGGSLAVMVLIAGTGLFILQWIRGDFRGIVGEADRMERFDFGPSPCRATFPESLRVMQGLERAKTALRSMSKYVPVELVRQLYDMNREPRLGGQLQEVSLMFTDIKSFTTLAESLNPDRLANALGLYLETMTRAVHERQGTIDKYIGDAVMALWNAPAPIEDHPRKMCQAALDCQAATEALFHSESWGDLPPLSTRFGLHVDQVLVGHFGAPDRMNYTALGDGVNLAARLEGLNKQYGTAAIVSQAVVDRTGEDFEYRLLDRVAVVGKNRAIRVYELLGRRGEVSADRLDRARRYEQALEEYLRGGFRQACEGFEQNQFDPPSQVMAERCRELELQPPEGEWDGIYTAQVK